MNICTIVAKNYLAHARVLAESFREHHPDSECFVLVIDDYTEQQLNAANEPFQLVRPSDLPLDPRDWDDMRSMYTVLEFSTAVKPWLLRLMLDEHNDGSGVAYFDPDIRIHSRMTELESTLGETDIVLTPHLSSPLPRDGMRPAEADIMLAGIYNLGFVGLSDGADTRALIPWWEERLRDDCWVAPERGLFVDQKWMDWVPGLYPRHSILRNPGYNLAYWNLPTRELAWSEAGGFSVDDHPLRFFHFSGYSPDRSRDLSKHQNRVSITEDGPLARVCDEYRERLIANGYEQVRSLPYSHDHLANGLVVDRVARSVYAKGVTRGDLRSGELFADPERFERYLRAAETATPGVSRYAMELWYERADLQAAYPEPTAGDREGFLGWCAQWGGETATRLVGGEAIASQEPAPTEITNPPEPPKLRGVNLFGYLHSELGVGEVARQLVRALDSSGVPSLPFVLPAPMSRSTADFTALTQLTAPHPVNLVCVNADMLPALAQQHPELLRDRTTIGYWWWELPDFPEHLHGAFALVDEVWVGSRYVADAISRHSPVPVVHIPVPIHLQPPADVDLTQFGVADDAYTFHFAWDYNSVFRRKNPLGLVEAFRSAFKPTDGATLVLKCINHGHHPVQHRQLLDAIADRPDIVVIDEHLPMEVKNGLINACDCYVSLHRSEGLGLTIAEAMLLGKPVISTDFSGSTDLVTTETGFPVEYRLVEVGEGSAPYDPQSRWAEPDLEHAARCMRQVFDDQSAAKQLGEQGRQAAEAQHDPAAVGHRIRERLEELGEPVAADQAPATADDLAGLIARRTLPRAPSRFGKPGAAARRGMLRSIKPYTAYQADVNDGFLERLGRLEDVDDDQRAAQARLDARQADLAATTLRQLRSLQRDLADNTAAFHRDRDTLSQQISETERRIHADLNSQWGERFDRQQRELDELRNALHTKPYTSVPVFSRREDPITGPQLACDADLPSAGGYVAFEDVFRGTEDFIADRQRVYVPLLADAGPVLDVGCGRGELLHLLAEAGIEARGVDLDASMVARGRERGLTIELGDGIEFLRGLEDASLGTVFSAQVIEHLGPEQLLEFMELASKKLRPGGRFIAETVNPHSPAALKAFWVDITHHHPLFPETMLVLARDSGFDQAFVFHPTGTGDWDRDRITVGEYALVATAS